MRKLNRRTFLDLATAITGATLSACVAPTGLHEDDDESTAPGDPLPGDEGPEFEMPEAALPSGTPHVGIAGYEDPGLRAAAVTAAIEMAGGMPWLKPGDRVLIKVAHNSPNPYPATSSPVACAELVKLLLQAGAGQVVIADLMGIENTLMPGGWSLEDPFGGGFDPDDDGTIRAFKASGIWDAVAAAVGPGNIGPNRAVHMTSFREDGWYRYESSADTIGTPKLCSRWLRDQVELAERWDGLPFSYPYMPRAFDALLDDVPGMYVPNLVRDVDHIINLHRISTHVMSHYTLAIKNWVGIMRPDDRIWMHQIGYLKNHRGVGNDPIRSEPPYNELLAELHCSTWERERLIIADASQVIASGGPDESDKDLFPAQLIVAARNLVAADVVGLSIIRQAVMASKLLGGLGGECSPPPQSAGSLALGFLGSTIIPWMTTMYGNDSKFCDSAFSHWDWIAVKRARELGMGCASPDELQIGYAGGAHAVPEAQRDFIDYDAFIPPAYG